jgi:hypothetical protein
MFFFTSRMICLSSLVLTLAACSQEDISDRISLKGNISPTQSQAPEDLELASRNAKGFFNLAEGQPTQQSSTAWDGEASRAADGSTDGYYWANSVTHTQYEYSPWWQVDLGEEIEIESLNIWNRTDCCQERLDNYWIIAYNSQMQPVWSRYKSIVPRPSDRIDVPRGLVARYVRIQIAGYGILSLAEVQVFGKYLITAPNFARSNIMLTTFANKCLDIEYASPHNMARALQFDCHGGGNQRFHLIDRGSGFFSIQAAHSGKCLDVAYADKKNGAALVQHDCHGGTNQLFKIRPRAANTFVIKPVHSEKCVNIWDNSPASGQSIVQYACHGMRNQRFRIYGGAPGTSGLFE